MKRSVIVILTFCLSSFAVLENPYMCEVPSEHIQAGGVKAYSDVRSKPATLDEPAEYRIDIENTTSKPREVEISIEASEKNISKYSLEKSKFVIADKASAVLKVELDPRMPVGSFEQLSLYITAGGEKSSSLSFKTVRFRQHPYALVTDELLHKIRTKIDNYPWAKQNYEKLLKRADRTQFKGLSYPEITTKGLSWKGLLRGGAERYWQLALAYKLSGNESYKEELIKFLLAVADPEKGYRSTRWATHSTAYVHEGEFFTFYPAIYDVLFDEPELSSKDHKQIQDTLRLYLETCKQWHVDGDIGNWLTTANAGALISSMVLQDMVSFDFFVDCENGFDDQLSYGIMGDGWWLEGASNYSYLVARFYGYVAEAADNWGINLYDKRVPAKYESNKGRRFKNGWMSMNFDIWGPPGKSYRCLKDLYDGATILMDENGYVVANNDSTKKKPGSVFELAYHYYEDPEYAWIISKDDRMEWQSLAYGAGELPEVEDPRDHSGYAANVGITALRSQGNKQDKAEQIQSFIKWGSHGGWHGHFDRTNFLALRRHGKDLFEPRASWFGYDSPMYKAWVEPSISHNLVIVDEYQQEPVESEQPLFYAGDNIQVSVVETNARWQEKQPWDKNDPADLDPTNMEKMVDYGDNEPVLQRRLMAVADDYVVVADYLEGDREHIYDWLMHPCGYLETEGDVEKTGYSPRMKDDDASSYYYITNCDRFEAEGHIVNKFKDKNLNLDIHTFLDDKTEMAVATYPFHLCRQPVEVYVDGKKVVDEVGHINNCNLYEIDVDISGAESLELRLPRRSHPKKGFSGDYMAIAQPRVISDGKTHSLTELDYKMDNFKYTDFGTDSDGNEINIAGTTYDNAMMITPQGQASVIKIDLSGINARRFAAVIGADHRDAWNDFERKTLQIRRSGKSFKLISIFEPYEGSSAIKNARLLDNDVVSIELKDGRTQQIQINNLESIAADDISVSFAELKDGKILEREQAVNEEKQLLYKDDFDKSLKNWKIEQMPGGSVQLTGGRLEIDDKAGCTVWFKKELAAPVAIEYDVEVIGAGGPNDRMSDINCFWMAQDPENPKDIFAESKARGGKFSNYNPLQLYYVGYAANNNTTTRFRRYDGEGNKPLLPEHDLRGYTLEPGTKLHIKIIAAGETNQYWVNGEKIYDIKDPKPYRQGHFGFRTVKNHIMIDNFRVYKLK